MKSHHYVEDGELIRTAQSAVPWEEHKRAIGLALERYLARQRTVPRLVGATRAAELMKVQPPHIARLKEQGRMPEPVEVEGSRDAYLLEEVLELADELEVERRERKRRRMEREEREEAKT